MKTVKAYCISFLLSLIVFVGIAHYFTPKNNAEKFTLPEFKNIFISSYGDHDAIHRIIYQGLFGFGKKIAKADVLLIGTSHTELGFSAEQISQLLSKQQGHPVKVVNMGMGWGEGFVFAKQSLIKLHVRCKILLIDLFATLTPRVSRIGIPVLSESKMTSYSKVIETWTITLRDWLLDGVLPRITFEKNKYSIKRFLAYPVGFRLWANGDVLDYWIPTVGEIYRKTPDFLITYPVVSKNNAKENLAEVNKILDPLFLRENHLEVISTLIPSNEMNGDYYITPVKELGLPFVAISFAGIQLYDQHHTNSKGRSLVTERLVSNWNQNKILSPTQAIQGLTVCRG